MCNKRLSLYTVLKCQQTEVNHKLMKATVTAQSFCRKSQIFLACVLTQYLFLSLSRSFPLFCSIVTSISHWMYQMLLWWIALCIGAMCLHCSTITLLWRNVNNTAVKKCKITLSWRNVMTLLWRNVNDTAVKKCKWHCCKEM